jgi:hypothetical protein
VVLLDVEEPSEPVPRNVNEARAELANGLVGSDEMYKDGKLISSTRVIKNQ